MIRNMHEECIKRKREEERIAEQEHFRDMADLKQKITRLEKVGTDVHVSSFLELSFLCN
jgi:hypothetical protein